MQHLTVADIKVILFHIKNIIINQQELLTQLDSTMGDGDLGITMTRGFTAAYEEAFRSDEKTTGKLFIRIGMAIAKISPSTMGTLLATGFMKGGKTIEFSESIGPEELALFFEVFVQSMMDRGKSAPGNKTIIDSLYPASRALRIAAGNSLTLTESILAAKTAAAEGLVASTGMKAQHGRAAYYQDASIGKQDGGATVGHFIIEGFCEHITGQ